ncbi:MAG: ecotin family protein [Synechococcaceae cyanobacterium]|nr:ecotin family protein [Synechococcaceae cyanobacterium]
MRLPLSAAARLARPGAGSLLISAALLLLAPLAQAIPRLDLKPYPAAGAGERRWVIQLPGVLTPSRDPNLSPSPSDWRVELLIGRELEVDCNRHVFSGRVRRDTLGASGLSVYRVLDVKPVVSTRMACPPEEAKRRVFLPMGSKPFVVPYNASTPIVIYAPADLQVRWRLWKAERQQRDAQAL